VADLDRQDDGKMTGSRSARARRAGAVAAHSDRAVRGRNAALRIAAAVAGGIAIIIAAGVWTHRSLEREVKRQVSDDLWAILATASRGVATFLTGAERLTALAVRAPDVGEAAQARHQAPGQARAQVTNAGAPPLGRALARYFATGQIAGYLTADADGMVLESSDGIAVPGQALPAAALPAAAVRAQDGPRAGLPFRARDGRALLLVVARVPDSPVLLALAFANEEFSAPLTTARRGASGETYGVDANGLMISSSRFAQQLDTAGLAGVDRAGLTFGVPVREPGGDVTDGYKVTPGRGGLPLTRAARAVIESGDGASLEPYSDYRGVPVVGAWTWFSARGFGIISEVDAAEALRPLRVLERIFAVLLALAVLAGGGTVVGWLFARRARERALLAEREVRRLGQYVVERQIGSGATGDVYLARHVLLKRPTALKLLRPHRDDGESLERFEREVQVTASMMHPHTVAIYDYGRSDDGMFFYAMEYLDGMDLERFTARFGPAPDARVIHILRQVCDSLGAAHARGLIHRDVKPPNVFLCRAVPDLVKVLDFGLVRIADLQTVSDSNSLMGTPATMAPELFESSDNASVASDIYAIGCVGYQLLTGQRVFSGNSLAELCNAHLSKEPITPSGRLGRAVDRTLEHALLACLAKRAANRPRSAAALAALLDESPARHAWTAADAAAFWAAHADTVAKDAAPSGPLTGKAIRVRARGPGSRSPDVRSS
jgi:tRNA A-37 threonylcarbamoyl transferase component Bud32